MKKHPIGRTGNIAEEKLRRRNFLSGRLLLPVLLLAGLAAPIRGEDPEFPLIQSLAYFPYSENVLPKGKTFSLGFTLQYANVFMFDPKAPVINDFETFSTTIAGRLALTKGVTLEAYFRFASIFPGKLDKTIEDFHRLFGLPDNYRLQYPRNIVQYRFYDSFDYQERKNFRSPAIVSLHVDLYRRPGFSLGSRIGVGIPIDNSAGLGGGKSFFSAGITATYQHRRTQIDASFYSAWYRKPDWLQPYLTRPAILFSEIKACWGSIIAGFRVRSSPFRTGDIAHTGYQISLGCRIGRYFEFLILEDLPRFDTTPDIGFSLNVKLI